MTKYPDAPRGRLRGAFCGAASVAALPAAALLGAAVSVVAAPAHAPVLSQWLGPALWVLLGLGAMRLGRIPSWRPSDAGALLSGVAATVCFYPAALLASMLAGRLFPGGSGTAGAYTAMGPVLAWVTAAFFPAFAEEFLFRGVLYGALRPYGAVPASVLTACCFACIHGSVQQAAYTFLMGLVWAALREATGSVGPCAVSHMMFNTAGLLAAFSAPAAARAPGVLDGPMALCATACCMALVGSAALSREHTRRNPLAAQPVQAPARRAELCLPVLLCAAAAAANVLANLALASMA